MIRRLVVTGTIALAATSATAQTQTPPPSSGAPAAPAAPSADFDLGGPIIPGLCMFDRNQLVANSRMGKATLARLQVLEREAEAEIDKLGAPLEAEIVNFEARRAKEGDANPAILAESRRIANELSGLQQISTGIRGEMETTRQKALVRLGDVARPLVTAAYKAKGCGALLDASAFIAANAAIDLTPTVLRELDTKDINVDFARERGVVAVLAPLQR